MADNLQVIDAQEVVKTLRAKETTSGVLVPAHLATDSAGNPINPATQEQIGEPTDSAWDGVAASASVVAVLKRISMGSAGAAAGTRVEGSLAAGGAAQNAFGAIPAGGFEIINTSATEILYIREGSTATVADNTFNVPINPRSSYMTPPGYKPIGDVSIIAATTGHGFVARRW